MALLGTSSLVVNTLYLYTITNILLWVNPEGTMTKEIQQQDRTPDAPSDFDRAFEELSAHFFEPFGLLPSFGGDRRGGPFLRPARTDVSDTGSAYRVVAEVPGIPKEKLDVRVRGSTVEIRGEQSAETTEHGGSFVHRERLSHGYYRAVELPEPVVATEAKAKVVDGLLELELPKQHPTPSPDEVRVPLA